MKRICFSGLSLLLILFCISCASNNVQPRGDSNNKNQRTEQKLRFDDWKYRGFGNALPIWVEFAVDNQIEKIQKADEKLTSAEILIFTGRGENLDQAEDSARQTCSQGLEGNPKKYELYDNFWVRMADDEEMPYISVYVYYFKE